MNTRSVKRGQRRGQPPCPNDAWTTILLFGGPASIDRLSAALHMQRRIVTATVDRLRLAGYARSRHQGDECWIELTDHARQWIERIGARKPGPELLDAFFP